MDSSERPPQPSQNDSEKSRLIVELAVLQGERTKLEERIQDLVNKAPANIQPYIEEYLRISGLSGLHTAEDTANNDSALAHLTDDELKLFKRAKTSYATIQLQLLSNAHFIQEKEEEIQKLSF